MNTPRIDLGADFNMEDDEGRNWTLVRDAREGVTVAPGAVLVAGQPGFWAVVRIVAVHDDGMVTFERLADDDPAARPVLAEAASWHGREAASGIADL